MEVIRIPGYTEDEKINIAKRYLLTKQIKNNGLRKDELTVGDAALRDIVRYYTREAGVRNLEREIAKICRKVVKELLLKKDERKIAVTPKNLDKYLGVRRFRYGRAEERDQVGQVTGLAWTEVGGELLTIESAIVPGKGRLIHTGQLGEVMQESIQAATTVVRSRSAVLGIDPDFYQKFDIHVHVPEGATPKDGPSAGVTMATALLSLAKNKKVSRPLAMTGELTLTGQVLPVGGIREKVIAARRIGIHELILPEANRRDFDKLPGHIRAGMTVHFARHYRDVAAVVFGV